MTKHDQADQAFPALLQEETNEDPEYDDSYTVGNYQEGPFRSVTAWLWPIMVIGVVTAWTGFFVWSQRDAMMAGAPADRWIEWIAAWTIPVLLIAALWLLFMRNSSREANRFGRVANILSVEAATLEDRLTTVNRELSLAREFLASQSRDLDTIGRVAADRLSEHAGALDGLIRSNGNQIDAIATVSATALENMNKLRDDLPVIANSAKDVSNQIGTAGMTAHSHIAELISGFDRLNDFGKASESQVDAIKANIDLMLSAFEVRVSELDELSANRFGALKRHADDLRAELQSHEGDALSAMQSRIDVIYEHIASVREDAARGEEDALEALHLRLSSLRDEARLVGATVRESEDSALEIWGERVAAVKGQLSDALAEIQRIDEYALDAANEKLELLRNEAAVVDASIVSRDALLMEKIRARRDALNQNEDEALERLTARFAQLDTNIAERLAGQTVNSDRLAEHSEAIAARIGSLTNALERAATLGNDTQASMARKVDDLNDRLVNSRQSIASTSSLVGDLTESCVRLLELVQASASHTQCELPDALASAERRLAEVKEEAEGVDRIVAETLSKAEQLSTHVRAAGDDERQVIADVDALQTRIFDGHRQTGETLDALTTALTEIDEQSDSISEKTEDRLRLVVASLKQAAEETPIAIINALQKNVAIIANDLATQAGNALERSLREGSVATVLELENSVSNANERGTETAAHLRGELAKVAELAGNLENRVARARDQAEEQVSNDFGRRMALLIESLNSNAIDIAKAVSTDVSDPSWAAYLKGDRGIFTRRAVRLLDNTEARDIAELYDSDNEFRENVSRYIHDFEAMLRSMLSTRDGNALGVTILSSDIGKLYVALAQALERLRN